MTNFAVFPISTIHGRKVNSLHTIGAFSWPCGLILSWNLTWEGLLNIFLPLWFISGPFSWLHFQRKQKPDFLEGLQEKGGKEAFHCNASHISCLSGRLIENMQQMSREGMIFSICCGFKNVTCFHGSRRVFLTEEIELSLAKNCAFSPRCHLFLFLLCVGWNPPDTRG